MKTLFVLLTVFLVGCSAHTQITGLVYNGATTPSMTCVRPLYPGNLYAQTQMGAQWPIQSSNFLVNGVRGENYTCGFAPFAQRAAQSKCTVAAGSKIGVSYYHGAGYGSEDAVLDAYIARSHKGPFIAYLAKSDTGKGDVWFKIYESGKLTARANRYEEVKWAVPDQLLENKGTMYFDVPSDIAPGNYLLRTEIIALHDTSASGAQPYVHCVELTVTGGGTINPPGVALPGYVQLSDPGLSTQYNIYNAFNTPYPIPGPKVYVPGSISPTETTKTTQTTTTTTTQTTRTTEIPPSTTDVPVPDIMVSITIKLQMAPAIVDLPEFIYEVTQALGIPAAAIADINIDLDQSTATTTVIHFKVKNVMNPATYKRVDPVATAYALRDMAARNDPALTSKAMLGGMEVLNVEELGTTDPEQGFVGSAGFVIMICVIGGTLIISATVVVVIVLIRKKRSGSTFF